MRVHRRGQSVLSEGDNQSRFPEPGDGEFAEFLAAARAIERDLNTGLAYIVGYVELLAGTPGLPSELREHLAQVRQAATRVLVILKQFDAAVSARES